MVNNINDYNEDDYERYCACSPAERAPYLGKIDSVKSNLKQLEVNCNFWKSDNSIAITELAGLQGNLLIIPNYIIICGQLGGLARFHAV